MEQAKVERLRDDGEERAQRPHAAAGVGGIHRGQKGETRRVCKGHGGLGRRRPRRQRRIARFGRAVTTAGPVGRRGSRDSWRAKRLIRSVRRGHSRPARFRRAVTHARSPAPAKPLGQAQGREQKELVGSGDGTRSGRDEPFDAVLNSLVVACHKHDAYAGALAACCGDVITPRGVHPVRECTRFHRNLCRLSVNTLSEG